MAIPRCTIADLFHRRPLWRNRGILVLNLCLSLPLLTAILSGMDSSLAKGLQILPEWQEYFHYPSGKSLGLINSAQAIGALVSMPFTPLASDRLGRRKALALGSQIMLGGVVLQLLSKDSGMLIWSRALVGFGLSFATNAALLLITELAYPTQRGKFTSMFSSSWYVGSVISAWICYGKIREVGRSPWTWRVPTLVQCIVPLLQIILIWFIPESPRWLVSQDREEEATSILSHFHADDLVFFEMAQIRHALIMEKEIHAKSSWLSLVATPGNRKRVMTIVALAVFSQWSGNGLVSYYFYVTLEGIRITSASTQAAINVGLQVFNLIAAMIGSFLIDKWGRRTLFIISNSGMLITFSAWTFTTTLFNNANRDTVREVAAGATIPFVFIFFFFYNIAYTPLLVAYTVEILPFNVRARGLALMNGTVALVLIFNQFVNPWALNVLSWRYYLLYCGWLVLELIFIVKYITETKGRTLEETATLFDGNAPPQDLVQRGEDAATMNLSPRVENMFRKSEARLKALKILEQPQRRSPIEFHQMKWIKSSTTDSTPWHSYSKD